MNNQEDKVTLSTKQKILQLRNALGMVANSSYSFSKINREHPLDDISENEGQLILKFYKDLIRDTLITLDIYRKEANT